MPKRDTFSLIVEILDSHPSFNGTIIYRSGGIHTKPYDFQILEYSIISLVICSTMAVFSYIIIPLSSTISNEESVWQSKCLMLKSDSDCNKGGKVVELIATCLSMKK